MNEYENLDDDVRREIVGQLGDAYLRGLAEQASGGLGYVGYRTNSPKISQLGDQLYNYSQSGESGNYPEAEGVANFLGRITPSTATTLAASRVNPQLGAAAGVGVDNFSELGVLINQWRQAGLSDEEIRRKLETAELAEGANSILSAGLLGYIFPAAAKARSLKPSPSALKMMGLGSLLAAEDGQTVIDREYGINK